MIEEVFVIKDYPYEDVINVVFTDNIRKSIADQCKQVGVNPKRYLVKEADAVCCFVNEKKFRATWVLFDITKMSGDILAHECVHLSFEILHKRGLKHKYSTDEAYAYLTGWLWKKINGFWGEFRLKHSKKIKSKSLGFEIPSSKDIV